MEVGGTALTLKTGVTVTVVPVMATDWPARRSTSSEVEVLVTTTGGEKVKV